VLTECLGLSRKKRRDKIFKRENIREGAEKEKNKMKIGRKRSSENNAGNEEIGEKKGGGSGEETEEEGD
jgi:hypothetical protein